MSSSTVTFHNKNRDVSLTLLNSKLHKIVKNCKFDLFLINIEKRYSDENL